MRVGTTGVVLVGAGGWGWPVGAGRVGDTGATVTGGCSVRCEGDGPLVPGPRQVRAARSRMASRASGDGPAGADAGGFTFLAAKATDSWACTAASAWRQAGDWVVSLGAGAGVWAWHHDTARAQLHSTNAQRVEVRLDVEVDMGTAVAL